MTKINTYEKDFSVKCNINVSDYIFMIYVIILAINEV